MARSGVCRFTPESPPAVAGRWYAARIPPRRAAYRPDLFFNDAFLKRLASMTAVIALATASQKGGVGKTTVCVNLGYSLARRGWRVLLADTDPQGAVGLSLARSTRGRRGFYDMLAAGLDLSEVLLPTRMPEYAILPAGQFDEVARHGLRLEDTPMRIRDMLRAAELRGFDVVLLDTAAGFGGVTEAVAGDAAATWMFI